MGEYATRISDGERVKIGTCESLYYLRADQRHLVTGGDLGTNPERDYWPHVRFRFPFPDEDEINPGEFEDHQRGLLIEGYDDRSAEADPRAPVYLEQQRLKDGKLMAVLWTRPEGQPYAGDGWRLETWAEAGPLFTAIVKMAEREQGEQGKTFLWNVAARVRAGYTVDERADDAGVIA